MVTKIATRFSYFILYFANSMEQKMMLFSFHTSIVSRGWPNPNLDDRNNIVTSLGSGIGDVWCTSIWIFDFHSFILSRHQSVVRDLGNESAGESHCLAQKH